jgi:hypothetical protein
MQAIDKSRKQRLRACERVLLEHMEEFVKVGLALKEIRDDRLYEADGHKTFDAYLKSRGNEFGIQKRYANDLIGSAELRTKLPAVVGATGAHHDEGAGWTERSVRELKRLPTTGRAKSVATQVIKEVERNGAKLTSTVVRKFVDRALGIVRTKSKPRPAVAPTFQDIIDKYIDRLKDMADILGKLTAEECELFAQEEPRRTKEFVRQIERVKNSLERIWAAIPD